MRRKTIILVSFLLMLYIAPMIFAPTYISPTIPAEQNMSKEFSMSDGASWLTGWEYRKKLHVFAVAGAGTDYTINITTYRYADGDPDHEDGNNTVQLENHAQTDFDDVRFTDANGSTQLNYYRQTYVVSDYAIFLIRISEDLSSDNVSIYIYYGNAGVSTTSDPEGVYLFFDDFENNNLGRWDTAQAQWSVQSATVKYGTYAAYGDSAATNRILSNNFTSAIDYNIMFHAWFRFQSTSGAEYPLLAYEEDGTVIYTCYSPSNEFSTNDGAQQDYFTNGQTGATWILIEIYLNFDTVEFIPFFNGVEKTHKPLRSGGGANVTDIKKISSILSSVTNQDHWIDDYWVAKWNPSGDPYMFSVDAEEEYVPPVSEWNEVGEATIYFNVSLDYWAFNMFMIFFGLVLVIASGCYLAYSIKHNISQDKFFYFLLAFFMGWGLFLGGMLI